MRIPEHARHNADSSTQEKNQKFWGAGTVGNYTVVSYQLSSPHMNVVVWVIQREKQRTGNSMSSQSGQNCKLWAYSLSKSPYLKKLRWKTIEGDIEPRSLASTCAYMGICTPITHICTHTDTYMRAHTHKRTTTTTVKERISVLMSLHLVPECPGPMGMHPYHQARPYRVKPNVMWLLAMDGQWSCQKCHRHGPYGLLQSQVVHFHKKPSSGPGSLTGWQWIALVSGA